MLALNKHLKVSLNVTVFAIKVSVAIYELKYNTFFSLSLLSSSSSVVVSGAPNDGLLLHTLKTLFRLYCV